MRSMPWLDAALAQSRTLDSGDSLFMLQQVYLLFFVRHFHDASFVSPFISTCDAVIRALANCRPLDVNM